MSLLNKASLIQIPSGYKDGTLFSAKPTNGDGDFTFSRGSNLAATRVNSEGLIEKGRENLFLHSNDFSQGAWSQNTQGVTRTSSSVTDPDGGTDAWEITTTATTDTHRLGHNINSGLIKTISFYAKANGYDYVRVWSWSGGNTNSNYFYLSGDGSVGGNGYGGIRKIESLGDGWYRCQCLIDGANGDTIVISPSPDENIANSTNSYLGDGTSGIYLFQAQLEAGLVATDYIETGASTAQAGILEDMPRLDYSGGATCGHLLLEPQRTNLVGYSELINPTIATSIWKQLGTNTFTSNYGIAPDGTQTSTRVQFVTANSSSQLYAIFNTSAADYTGSIYLKGSGILKFGFYDNSSVLTDTITLTSEWKRFDVTKTLAATSGARFWIYPEGAGATQDFEIWGAQCEQASYPTSYIPTYGASVTRGADSCTLLNTSNIIGQTEGTLFFDADFNIPDSYNISLSDSSSSNYISIDTTSDKAVFARVQSGGATQATINTSGNYFENGERLKCAIAYKANDFAFYINGTQIGTDTSGSVPATDDIRFARFNGSLAAYQNINQVTLFNTRLSNDELASLTTL